VVDANVLADTEHPAAKPPARPTSDTFCIRLWQYMRLESNGQVRPCCIYTRGYVKQDGKAVSADRQSLMEIWNADTSRELRRAMVEGRRVEGCSVCYATEARGGVSTRMSDNMVWQRTRSHEPGATIDAMMAQAVDNDYRLPKLPATIEIEAGNLCNLKCRMCNIFSSSRIANDPVQREWDTIRSFPHEALDVEIDPGKIRRAAAIESLADELAKDTASEVRQLSFLGGEPFLLPQIPRLLERLVAAGRARQLSLLFISNGTVVPEWLSLAAQFRRVQLAVSVDGYGNDLEYIRFPARWPKLARNLQLFKKIPNVSLSVTTTIQVNNVLGITRLFRYLDSVEIAFSGYLLHYPGHHAVGILPASIRRLAAARLRDYAEADCHPARRALVLSFATQIEAGDEAADPGRLRDFMLFTNDLDASRGQSIHRNDPELVELLEQAGFPWLHETLHATAASVAKETRRWRLALTEARNAAAKLQQELSATRQMLPNQSVQSRDMLVLADVQAKPVNRELARVRLELAKVYASLSWRVTRPLRAARRILFHG
jgi:MoaA/NifB/PqqE/SkfB family radical SAM enzyme